MKSLGTTALLSIGGGFLLTALQAVLGTTYLAVFLSGNLITILITLLAINGATLAVVLTKVRDLLDRSKVERKEQLFSQTRRAMLTSLKEQLCLIVTALVLLMSKDAPILISHPNAKDFVDVLIASVFIFSLQILYDTTKSIFVILDLDAE